MYAWSGKWMLRLKYLKRIILFGNWPKFIDAHIQNCQKRRHIESYSIRLYYMVLPSLMLRDLTSLLGFPLYLFVFLASFVFPQLSNSACLEGIR